MKHNSKQSKAQFPLQSRTHKHRNSQSNILSFTNSKYPTINTIQSSQSILKKTITLSTAEKAPLLTDRPGNLKSILDADMLETIRNEIKQQFEYHNYENRLVQLQEETMRLKSALTDLIHLHMTQRGDFNNFDTSSISSEAKENHLTSIEKEENQKPMNSEIKQLKKNLTDKLQGAIKNNQFNTSHHPYTARSQCTYYQTNNNSNSEILMFSDSSKLEQIKENIIETKSPKQRFRSRESKSTKRVSPHQIYNKPYNNKVLPQSSQAVGKNLRDAMMFRSLQTFSAMAGAAKHTHNANEKLPVSGKGPIQSKISPIRVQKTLFATSDFGTSREPSANKTQGTSKVQAKNIEGGYKRNTYQISSLNANALGNFWKDLKKTRQKGELGSKSLHKNHLFSSSQRTGRQNLAYYSSSINSNFALYKDRSFNNRKSQKGKGDTNLEQDNTAPFNFSNENSKGRNPSSEDESKAIQSSQITQCGTQMRMDNLLQKPSQNSSFLYSPQMKGKNNHILIEQNAQSIQSIKITSPQSQSPTAKRSRLSTMEENTLDFKVKSIGQSLTDRLHVLNLDKKLKFSSSSNGNLSNLLGSVVTQKEMHACTCDDKQNNGLLSQKSKKNGASFSIMTPSRDDIQFEEEKEEDLEPCSNFCIRLRPQQQKEIIRQIMKREYGQDLKIFANKADLGFPNEKKYIIDAKWWRNWCDYTGFEVMQQEQATQIVPNQEETLRRSLDVETAIHSSEIRFAKNSYNKEKLQMIKQDKKGLTSRVNDRYNGKNKKGNEQSKELKHHIQMLDQQRHQTESNFSNNLEMIREELIKSKRLQIDETKGSSGKQSANLEFMKKARDRGLSENNRVVFNDYKNPGKMRNLKLVDESYQLNNNERLDIINYKLKSNICEHHDYEAVSFEIWKYISSWYSYDVAICRYLLFDNKTEKTFLDLYPKSLI